MPPWPEGPDRLSPSGPFLPLQRAGFIQAGSDCLREVFPLGAGATITQFPRSTTPDDFIEIPLPGFRLGNSVLTGTAISFLAEAEPEPQNGFAIINGVLLGIAGVPAPFVVENAFHPMGADPSLPPDNARTLAQWALFRPDPEFIRAALGNPAVESVDIFIRFLLIANGGGAVAASLLGGATVTAAGGSSWFVAAELGEDTTTQVCPVTLVPIP